MKRSLVAALALLTLTCCERKPEQAAAPAPPPAATPEDHGNTVAVTTQNWKTEVEQSDKPVLLDFWAPWCAPCLKLSPSVAALSKEMTNVKFGKVNYDDSPELVDKFSITVIPYLVVLDHGKKIAEYRDGYPEPAQLKKFVTDAVSKVH